MGEDAEFRRVIRSEQKRVKEEQRQQNETNETNETKPILKEDPNATKPEERRSYDWICTMGSYHYAKHRASFTTYLPITATAGGGRVTGIGTVRLSVMRSPTDQRSHIIELKDVLHMPDGICNGINLVSLPSSEGLLSGDTFQATSTVDGLGICYGKSFVSLWRLVLAEEPTGVSVLQEMADAGAVFLLSLHLRPGEDETIRYAAQAAAGQASRMED